MSKRSDQMTESMSKSSGRVLTKGAAQSPKKGEKYRCESCGMKLEVTESCNCKNEEEPHFRCCGGPMARA
jgi:hypothetical protein